MMKMVNNVGRGKKCCITIKVWYTNFASLHSFTMNSFRLLKWTLRWTIKVSSGKLTESRSVDSYLLSYLYRLLNSLSWELTLHHQESSESVQHSRSKNCFVMNNVKKHTMPFWWHSITHLFELALTPINSYGISHDRSLTVSVPDPFWMGT